MTQDWFKEGLYESYGQSMRMDKLLFDSKTDHQRLRLFENAEFGRILTLDDVVQTTQGDEFIYHEMMAHVPLFAHGAAKQVLIIGGGDGGMAREVLKHSNVEKLTQVEIDAGVVEFSKQYLPMLSDGAFDDPRFNLVIADGADFVAKCADKFDVIIIDSTDPIGPGEVLFTDTFYGKAKGCLTPDGILVTQNGVPFMQGDELTNSLRAFQALFNHGTCYLATIPTYVGGPMAMGFATGSEAGKTSLATLDQRFAAAGIDDLRYYTPEVHQAAFALPGYVKALFPS